jgi:membrane protein YqaA with SNARE-associated domain
MGIVMRQAGAASDSTCSKFQQSKFLIDASPAALRHRHGCFYTQEYMEHWINHLTALLALPEYSLGTVVLVSFISATLLPLGSEPVVFGLIKLNPDLMWQVIGVATLGNTLGGAVDWWMGLGAHKVADKYSHSRLHVRALDWLHKLGPKACLLAWLPLVGDPLCAVAGWLRMPFWPCLLYMAIGKFLRYLVLTSTLMGIFS